MAMTREEAVVILQQLTNSGILSEELEEELNEMSEHICKDDFEKCVGSPYCEGCKFLNN